MTNRDERFAGDTGQVGGIEGVTFGVLIFVLGILAVANVWGVIDAKAAASAAAREGARAIVETRQPNRDAALDEARAVVDETLRGYGRSLGTRGRFVPETVDFRRCGRVTVRVEYDVPLLAIPIIGGHGNGFTAVGRHSEIVDPFRSGIADRSACPDELTP